MTARAACGTHAGYQRHLRRREPACPPCRDAANRYKRHRRARLAASRPGRTVLRDPTAADLDAAIADHPDTVIVAIFDQETP